MAGMSPQAVREISFFVDRKAVKYHGLSGIVCWRQRQSHCPIKQGLKMQKADYAPDKYPSLMRLMKCLKMDEAIAQSAAERH